MSDIGVDIVSELIKAADETGKLQKPERAGLLERAATALRDYGYQLNSYQMQTNGENLYVAAHQCSQMARSIDSFTAVEVAVTLLDAARSIKATREFLDEKQIIEWCA